jgi:hypothetical protein
MAFTEAVNFDQNISIYPNPTADGAIQISIPEYRAGEMLQLKLISTQGKRVAELRGDRLSIERNIQDILNKQSSGFYFVIVQHNKKTYRQKLMLSKKS